MNRPKYYSITMLGRKTIYTRAGEERIVGDWFTLAGPCDTREEAEDKGQTELNLTYPINPVLGPNLERDTVQKNMVVVPKSKLHQYHITLED